MRHNSTELAWLKHPSVDRRCLRRLYRSGLDLTEPVADTGFPQAIMQEGDKKVEAPSR